MTTSGISSKKTQPVVGFKLCTLRLRGKGPRFMSKNENRDWAQIGNKFSKVGIDALESWWSCFTLLWSRVFGCMMVLNLNPGCFKGVYVSPILALRSHQTCLISSQVFSLVFRGDLLTSYLSMLEVVKHQPLKSLFKLLSKSPGVWEA